MLSHLKKFDRSGRGSTTEAYRVLNLERLQEPDPAKPYSAYCPDLKNITDPTPKPPNLLVIHDGGGEWSMSAPPIVGDGSSEEYERTYNEFVERQKTWLDAVFEDPADTSFPRVLVNVKALPELVPSENGGEREFRSQFWKVLRKYEGHVGIVIAMSTLRRFGAAISLGLSWEQTIEDFAAELHLFPQLRALSQFRHLFVRVGLIGLIHIENEAALGRSKREAAAHIENKEALDRSKRNAAENLASAACPFRGRVYFTSYTLEGFERDPDDEGRVIGKNSLLIASLALQHLKTGSDHRPNQSSHAICAGIRDGIRAIIKFHHDGYARKILLEPPVAQPALIRESIAPIRESPIFNPNVRRDVSERSDEFPLRDCAIPDYLLEDPLPNKLRTMKPWRMLNDSLQVAPVHRINVAMAIVKAGYRRVLNKNLKQGDFQKNAEDNELWEFLTRVEYWNSHDRAPDYMTLEEGEYPSPPVLDRRGMPEIRGDLEKGVELNVPVIRFGNLTVAEREEIEGLCGVKNLLKIYIRDKEHYRKPMSVAVFGPPGTGKSYAVKQILKTIDSDNNLTKILEYNMAQFKGVEDLGVALHNIGPVNHQGLTPIVFFDEFDCVLNEQPLGWLKYFLAPMQDGTFYGANHTIDIGRAIFVFAGGIYSSFERFDPRTVLPDEELGLEISNEHKARVKQFAERKGPDFISRLRGHINISQINADPGRVKHFIRRALVLRSLIIERGYTHPKGEKEGTAIVDEEVIYALLTIDRYRHGIRSMEAILHMCTPIDGRIHIASLPSRAQLNMHVDAEEFFIRLYRGRARQYLENDPQGLATRLEIVKRTSVKPENEAIAKTAEELLSQLKSGRDPTRIQQKLEVLEKLTTNSKKASDGDLSRKITAPNAAIGRRVPPQAGRPGAGRAPSSV